MASLEGYPVNHLGCLVVLLAIIASQAFLDHQAKRDAERAIERALDPGPTIWLAPDEPLPVAEPEPKSVKPVMHDDEERDLA